MKKCRLICFLLGFVLITGCAQKLSPYETAMKEYRYLDAASLAENPEDKEAVYHEAMQNKAYLDAAKIAEKPEHKDRVYRKALWAHIPNLEAMSKASEDMPMLSRHLNALEKQFQKLAQEKQAEEANKLENRFRSAFAEGRWEEADTLARKDDQLWKIFHEALVKYYDDYMKEKRYSDAKYVALRFLQDNEKAREAEIQAEEHLTALLDEARTKPLRNDEQITAFQKAFDFARLNKDGEYAAITESMMQMSAGYYAAMLFWRIKPHEMGYARAQKVISDYGLTWTYVKQLKGKLRRAWYRRNRAYKELLEKRQHEKECKLSRKQGRNQSGLMCSR